MLAHLGAMLAHLEANVGPSWGYVGPSWAMLAHLRAMLAHLEGNVGPSWGYVGPSWGLCWPIFRPRLAHVDPSWATKSENEKNGKSTKHRKMALPRGRRLGRRPLSPTERRETPAARTRPGGPWPILGAMLSLLGTMLAHLGAMLAHLGGYVGPSWGYVDTSWGLCWPMLTHLEPQRPKNWKKLEEHETP